MNYSLSDTEFMRRALQLAEAGRGSVSPNPMVGAVIVHNQRIIGEGWHRKFGQAHAEVNAVKSVSDSDRALLPESTIYVTLEPCSHYGKTPPCALLLRDTGFKRVVVGTLDPNPKVAGRGVEILRSAGITVDVGLLEDECLELNRKFFTAHTRHYPYVTLKWAQGADGSMDGKFSTPHGALIVHGRRAEADAIIVGARTVMTDDPMLNTRLVAGHSPRPVILDRNRILEPSGYKVFINPDTLHITDGRSLRELLDGLYRDYGYISVMVEGGAAVLSEFISEKLWDEAHVELSPNPGGGKTKAPVLPCLPVSVTSAAPNIIYNYIRQD